jgi:WD40 repeat protein
MLRRLKCGPTQVQVSLVLGVCLLVVPFAGVRADSPLKKPRAVLDKLQSRVTRLSFSQDGKWLAATSSGAARVWDTATWKEVGALRDPWINGWGVAVSPDRKTLAVAGPATSTRLCDTTTWKPRRLLKTIGRGIGRMFYSPDGQTLLCQDGSWLRFLDPETGAEGSRVLWPDYRLSCLNYAPYGKMLMGGGFGTAAVYDLEAKKFRLKVEGLKGNMLAVAIHADGGHVAISTDPTVMRPKAYLWDLTAGKQTHELKGEAGMAADFSPDGRSVALAAFFGEEVWLYDVGSGKRRATFDVSPTKCESLMFSPDGQLLVTGCSNGHCGVWDVPPRPAGSKSPGEAK